MLGFAQSPSALPVSSPTALNFEVATIKPNASDNGGSSGFDRDRFRANDIAVKGLLRFEAFMVADARIVGGPKWLNSARFDIDAKLDAAEASKLNSLALNEKKMMQEALIQRLLADRFQLKMHWEEREQPIYALVVAKGGAKLKPAADTKDGSKYSLSYGKFDGKDLTVAQMADLLTQGAPELGRVVVDRTGISGAVDLDLKWASDTGASNADASSPAASGPSLFTAIQEQLGLKLEPSKGPVKVLVIDQLEMPSDN
jgi:uncharacterized protein (TIGR03435 family)